MPSPCTVTATLNNASGTALITNDTFLRFILRNYKGFVPRIAGAAIITETQIDAAPDGSGNVSVGIWGNDNIDPINTFYTVEQHTGGRITSSANYSITGASFDLDSASQINPPNPPASAITPILLEHDGTKNGSQILLNLKSGSGISIADDGVGGLTIGESGSTGALAITSGAAPATLNVSTEGTKDWCAINGSAVSGSTAPNVYLDSIWHWKVLGGYLRRTFRWLAPFGTTTLSTPTSSTAMSADAGDDGYASGTGTGTPTAPMSSNTSSVRLNANTSTPYTNWGFSLEAPADTNSRTLKLYMGGQSATITITARLSDGSAADQTANIAFTTEAFEMATVAYNAASSGQRLNVSAVVTTFGDSSTGIIFQGATLS